MVYVRLSYSDFEVGVRATVCFLSPGDDDAGIQNKTRNVKGVCAQAPYILYYYVVCRTGV